MPSLGHIRKTAEALKREDAPPEHASVQVKFRLKRPRSRVLSGAKSSGSSSRQPLGTAAGEGSSWKRKATDIAGDAGSAKRAATREKGAEDRDQEKFRLQKVSRSHLFRTLSLLVFLSSCGLIRKFELLLTELGK